MIGEKTDGFEPVNIPFFLLKDWSVIYFLSVDANFIVGPFLAPVLIEELLIFSQVWIGFRCW